jgi:hypothetical protein
MKSFATNLFLMVLAAAIGFVAVHALFQIPLGFARSAGKNAGVRSAILKSENDPKAATLSPERMEKEILAVSKKKQGSLQAQGVDSLRVRNFTDDSPYMEILAYSKEGKVMGGHMVNASRSALKNLESALDHIGKETYFRGSSSTSTSARQRFLTVLTRTPHATRAYANGQPLSKRVQGQTVIFRLPIANSKTKHSIELTLTADNGPLVRRGVDLAKLEKDLKWSLLPPATKENPGRLSLKDSKEARP